MSCGTARSISSRDAGHAAPRSAAAAKNVALMTKTQDPVVVIVIIMSGSRVSVNSAAAAAATSGRGAARDYGGILIAAIMIGLVTTIVYLMHDSRRLWAAVARGRREACDAQALSSAVQSLADDVEALNARATAQDQVQVQAHQRARPTPSERKAALVAPNKAMQPEKKDNDAEPAQQQPAPPQQQPAPPQPAPPPPQQQQPAQQQQQPAPPQQQPAPVTLDLDLDLEQGAGATAQVAWRDMGGGRSVVVEDVVLYDISVGGDLPPQRETLSISEVVDETSGGD